MTFGVDKLIEMLIPFTVTVWLTNKNTWIHVGVSYASFSLIFIIISSYIIIKKSDANIIKIFF